MPRRLPTPDTPIARIMAEEGRTLTWLAERAGVAKSSAWQWLHLGHVPRQPTRRRVEEALRRNPEELWS